MANTSFPKITWVYDGSNGLGDWPSFSPDGTQIVFVIGGTSYALYTISTDGTGLQQIYPAQGAPGNGSRPDWAWNASAIAFAQQSSSRENAAAIWTVAPDGTSAAPYNQSLSADLGLIYPSWSQNCESLVAVGYTGRGSDVQASLYAVTPSTIVQITNSPNPVAGRPSVSPSGPIAFAGNQGQFSQWSNQIWVVAPATGLPPQRIEQGADLASIQGRSPNWSPLGDLIVFESTRYNQNPAPGSPLALWVMNTDGTGAYPVTDIEALSAYHAEWSRQQDRIVFASAGRIGIIEMAEP